MMADDVVAEQLPIATGPTWGVPDGTGFCVVVDEAKVETYYRLYEKQGQFLPYQQFMFGRECE